MLNNIIEKLKNSNDFKKYIKDKAQENWERLLKNKMDIIYLPKNGEKWYIRLRKASILCSVEVQELTERTVLLKFNDYSNPSRYELSDVNFIEKIK